MPAPKKSNQNPRLTDYGARYYSDSLSKKEVAELHKWRMKNDPEYKDKVKSDILRKKITEPKTSTPKTTPRSSGGNGGGGAGAGRGGVRMNPLRGIS